QGVVDGAARDFIVAYQPGKDGQAGRVGRSPGIRALHVRGQVPDRRALDAPAAVVVGGGVVKLVEPAVLRVDHQHVLIADGVGGALDRSVGRHGHWSGIALGRRADRDRHLLLYLAVDDHIRNATADAEVGMDANGRSDVVDDRRGVGVDRRRGDVLVPGAVRA